MNTITRIIKTAFSLVGLSILNKEIYEDQRERLKVLELTSDDIEILKTLNGENSKKLIQYIDKSKAQLRQDIFVLNALGFKHEGFFVEFGATNGLKLSNTYLLEKDFNWGGIVAEPAKIWHSALASNRSCHIDTDCVWVESGSFIEFNEVNIGELSTINIFSDVDNKHFF